MKLAPESRDILRRYRRLINERRAADGLTPLRTEQVIDDLCYFLTCQSAVYLCGQFIHQGEAGR